jgi:hypothetical protein
MLGDFYHKFGEQINIVLIYNRMLRNNEFYIWKVFYSIILIFSVIISNDAQVIFLFTVIVNIINIFYIYDVYKIELRNLSIYQFSNYTYRKFILSKIIGNLIIKQDILSALIIICIIKMDFILIMYLVISMMITTMWEFCSNIFFYYKYPIKRSPYLLIPIFILSNLIGINFILAFIVYGKTDKNWNKVLTGGENHFTN